MDWRETKYDSPELVRISERLNKCNEDKLMTELELVNEEFKSKYITKRKRLTADKATTRMGFIIVVGSIISACVSIVRDGLKIPLPNYGVGIAATMVRVGCIVVMVFGVVLFVKLSLPELKMLSKFNKLNKNTHEDNGIITFEKEQEISRQKISMLKAQLDTISKEIEDLLARKREEEILRKQKIDSECKKTEETTSEENADGAFKIKKDKISGIQAVELLAYYDKEISDCKGKIKVLEREDALLKIKIREIDDDFAMVKKKIIKFLISVLVLTFAHNIFSGKTYTAVGIILGVFLIAYFIKLVSVCTNPILMYLVEHRNKQIQDYAFVHSMKPFADRRKEIAEDVASYKRNVDYFEGKVAEVIEECEMNDNAS